MEPVESLSLGDFPPELLRNVFSYLTQSDLLNSVAFVCRIWHRIVWDQSLWKRLKLCSDCDKNNECIFDRIGAFLATLSLSYANHVSDESKTKICSHICKCSRLQKLEFAGFQYLTVEHLTPMIESCPDVQIVNFYRCHWVDDHVLNILLQWKQLRDVNLAFCFDVTNNGIRNLVANCANLTDISLEQIEDVTDRTIITLVDARCNFLSSVNVNGFMLTNKAYIALSNCYNLKKLIVRCAKKMTDSGLLACKKLKDLRHLEVENNKLLSAIALKDFFRSDSLKQLVFLNLLLCKGLRDDGVKAIAQNCQKLQHLNLNYCSAVTDAGIEDIIRNCRELSILKLKYLKLHGSCFDIVPFPLQHLEYIELQYSPENQVIDRVVKHLLARNPNLAILNRRGTNVVGGVISRKGAIRRRHRVPN